MEEIGQVEDFS